MNVLCLVELDDAGVTDASLRALTFARSLIPGTPGEPGAVAPDGASPVLAGVAFGPADRVPARLLGSYGVTEVYVVEPATLDGYAPQAWARTLEGLLSVTLAAAVVAAGTDCGSEVLAHLGALTGQPMAANCIAAAPAADGTLEVSRQRWAGLLIEDATLEGTPALLTVATDAVAPLPADAVPGDAVPGDAVPADAVPGEPVPADPVPADAVPADAVPGEPVPADAVPADAVPGDPVPAEPVPADAVPADAVPPDAVPPDAVPADPVPAEEAAEPPVHVHEPDLDPADLRVRAAVSASRDGGVSLASARVVVGGGRGVGGPGGFAPLEELAGLLGGVVGVSRVVTSQGWRPHTQQVGQTGTKITPELYLACGISGAIQHMAGCASAKHIVVVNTDPSAPILSRADYAVIGDLAEVIPALVAALKERA